MRLTGILNTRYEAMDQAYIEATQQWRAKMEADLRAPDGWLALAGLFWLRPGSNTVGADPASDIVLPEGFAPARAATIDFDGEHATLHARPGVPIAVNGEPAEVAALRSDADPPADRVQLGPLTLLIIKRGEKYGVRLRNKQHPNRAAFAGRRWYPIRPEYCVPATFIAYDPPQPRQITNVLGDVVEELSPGYVRFELNGQEYQLEASPTSARELFLVFRDRTAGTTTYPAGRFVKAPLPRDGQTTVDFNRAYSPPCAFTEFATCPLPVPQNRLGIPIEAGELYDGAH